MGDQDHYQIHNINGQDHLILIDQHFFKRVDQRTDETEKFAITYNLLANQSFKLGSINERLVVRDFQQNISFVFALEGVTEYDTDRFDPATNFSEKVYFITFFEHAENFNQSKAQRNVIVTHQGSIHRNLAITSEEYVDWFIKTNVRKPRTLFN